ncbi:hypothetical protein CA943_05335 [Taylorella equigenitalis]|uniref:Transmembrane protein n=1 Tax=Taylorella equigenitalis (strain MCE9) TaxID=937774 RepID=A0A654KF82_TAYEM|nr:hypothetical protein TEQUI_0116 [Taylorella equigenitalis MCE9]ASY39581.1 hypothetical protein CA604_05570 [Taylorella equigenitalis]ASY42522.1 hypothetical protein CA943_05335 [Taylorella equigenitalis]KGK34092.1 hypothetical protein LW90_00580 [Taylorella equigenitalis]
MRASVNEQTSNKLYEVKFRGRKESKIQQKDEIINLFRKNLHLFSKEDQKQIKVFLRANQENKDLDDDEVFTDSDLFKKQMEDDYEDNEVESTEDSIGLEEKLQSPNPELSTFPSSNLSKNNEGHTVEAKESKVQSASKEEAEIQPSKANTNELEGNYPKSKPLNLENPNLKTELEYLRANKGITIDRYRDIKKSIQMQFYDVSNLTLDEDEPMLWVLVYWKKYLREEIRQETQYLKDFMVTLDKKIAEVSDFVNKLDKVKQNQLREMVSLFEHKRINLDEIAEALLNEMSTNGLKYYQQQNKGIMQFIEKKLSKSTILTLGLGLANLALFTIIAFKFI